MAYKMKGFSGFGNSPLKQTTKEEPRIDRWVRKSKEVYNKTLGRVAKPYFDFVGEKAVKVWNRYEHNKQKKLKQQKEIQIQKDIDIEIKKIMEFDKSFKNK